jgi:hypothetical protein
MPSFFFSDKVKFSLYLLTPDVFRIAARAAKKDFSTFREKAVKMRLSKD